MKKEVGCKLSIRMSRRSLRSQAVCWTEAMAAIHSASHVENAVMRCFMDPQHIVLRESEAMVYTSRTPLPLPLEQLKPFCQQYFMQSKACDYEWKYRSWSVALRGCHLTSQLVSETPMRKLSSYINSLHLHIRDRKVHNPQSLPKPFSQ